MRTPTTHGIRCPRPAARCSAHGRESSARTKSRNGSTSWSTRQPRSPRTSRPPDRSRWFSTSRLRRARPISRESWSTSIRTEMRTTSRTESSVEAIRQPLRMDRRNLRSRFHWLRAVLRGAARIDIGRGFIVNASGAILSRGRNALRTGGARRSESGNFRHLAKMGAGRAGMEGCGKGRPVLASCAATGHNASSRAHASV